MVDPIITWEFHEAPEELQALSENGGDENWLTLIPQDYLHRNYNSIPMFLQDSSYGCCNIEEHVIEWEGKKYLVLIGCH
jgi:hypothetical protein